MKTALMNLIVLIMLGQAAHAQTEPAQSSNQLPLLLLTFFDPFGGASTNNSNLVGEKLKTVLADRYEVHTCLVPTVYDAGFDVALHCMLELSRKPDLVLSLGEGSPCSKIDVETTAQNLDSDFLPDNAGVVRSGHTIIPNDLPVRKITYFNRSNLEALIQREPNANLSSEMGNFVCNNLAFHFVSYLENYSVPQIPYAFIHVPPHSCYFGMSVDETASTISNILKIF